ncbi:mitochondrial ribosomal protein L17 [Cylindrobasidium torrendii FP15055 ss-10]|uniref:Mitochondrial ribosomal protein L17 n=1 Tax=Cylindrobasidium torrendii FP15055 ss-10 TaxID=1314674 RepID=A0A0D7AX69_9AGAR|nr:mitochondrial ribosomal protein L17 [Cylindrobasidium torrendii FP15055 ss-10]
MKHGVAFRKFSRTMSHRDLMLRNLVTSLLEHEQIQTTLPKAKDAARLAEKIISLGKRNDAFALTRARAFLLKEEVVPKLFGTFAKRYAERPGGYTRIHKYGNRFGDNAPMAILELVDNPRDLRFDVTSRTVGWEMLKEELKRKKPTDIIQTGVRGVHPIVEKENKLKFGEAGVLRSKTRWNLQKVLRYRGPQGLSDLTKKAREYADHVLATRVASDTLKEVREVKAGQALPGDTRSAKQIANGALGVQKQAPSDSHILSVKRMFGRATEEPAPL